MGGNPAEGGNGGRMDDVAEALNERQRGILDEVLGLIQDVLAEDWIEDAVFDEHTSFAGDLNIESIEIVALAEAIHDRYGEDVNLAGWFAEMDINDVLLLTLGDLVRHVDESIEAGRSS